MTSNSKSQSMIFLPLGGIGEIGMNAYLYGLEENHERQWLLVDLGITFPGPGEPGVDVILPDITFLEEEQSQLKGILLTHAHEDHFGAVIELWPRLKVPVYATPFTAGLLKAKLAENGLKNQIPVKIVQWGKRFKIGGFDLELVHMAHSIPEPCSVVFRSAGGVVLHSGDWKMDHNPVIGAPIDEKRLREIGEEGVDVLVCDSTNAPSAGMSPNESDVAENLIEIFKRAKQRIIATTFASNVGRLVALIRAAEAAERHVILAGRALHRIVMVAQEAGYISKKTKFLSDEDYGYLPREKVVVLCTGSQGEPRAAMARIARKEFRTITLAPGDMVLFSSRAIPGNEKAVSEIQNKLIAQGAELITDKDALIHVSGHPRQGELEILYNWLKPKALLPMHGEERHLEAQRDFMAQTGKAQSVYARNGDMVRLLPAPMELIDDAPVGRLYRDGAILTGEEDPAIRLRRKLSFAGYVVVSITIDKKGEVIADPLITFSGIPEHDGEGEMCVEVVLDAVWGVLESIPKGKRKSADRVSEAVRRGVRAAIRDYWGKKPICTALVTVI